MTETTEEKPRVSYMVVGRAGSGTQKTAASYEVFTVEEAATMWASEWMTENQAIVDVLREEELVRRFHIKCRPGGWLLDDVAEQEAKRADEKISGMQVLKAIEALANIALIVGATKIDDDIVGKVRELAESWNARQEELRSIYKALGEENTERALATIQALVDECVKRRAERDLAYADFDKLLLAKTVDVASLKPKSEVKTEAKTEEKPVERIVFAQRERSTTTSAKATVQVVLEIAASGTWGRDSTLAQVDTQAIDSVEQRLARIVNIAARDGIDIKVLGAPSIVSIGFDSKPR